MKDFENRMFHFDNLLLISEIFTALMDRVEKLEKRNKKLEKRFNEYVEGHK